VAEADVVEEEEEPLADAEAEAVTEAEAVAEAAREALDEEVSSDLRIQTPQRLVSTMNCMR
jgi:hypothetical protein